MTLAAFLLLVPMGGFAVETTAIQGIVYRADGTVAQGTMLVSWPAFTAPDGSTIAAGTMTATIAPDGSVNLALTPNAGANPAGTYYTVVYHMNDGTVVKEYWVVPQAATAAISQLRARVVPAAVAQQTVSQQYVDASINALQGALQGSYLQLKGGAMSGALKLSSDPMDPLEAATKEYVDAHAGSQLPQAQNVIAGRGDGGAVSLAEKGVTVSGANGTVAWDEDLNAGIYDPRDPRWAGGIYGPTPAAAAQAMSTQMACDLAMGKVKYARARWPQGTFLVDQLLIAPGSSWEGTANSTGGTVWHTQYNNHQTAYAPPSMTVTCSDGQQHTDSLGGTRVAHFTLQGCAQGGCTNAPGDTANYAVAGPYNTGLEMSNSAGIVEYVTANAFGGYAIRVDGQDTKSFHLTGGATGGSLEWYYYGGYKGLTESAVSAEVNATTTGSTGSVALSWPAVANATGYVVYRGTSAGGESVFYITTTNSLVDTGAAGNSGSVTNVVTNTLTAPAGVTATPSATGGTLAAATYYYRITATTADGWHGSMEFAGADTMADWIESYGMFDLPTAYTYHHLADILGGGGDGHFDHLWPQLGQVGIAQPWGAGAGDTYENVRIDFTRLEGFWTEDTNVNVNGGVIDGSCTGSNAATINTGQEGARFAGQCNQYWATGGGDNLTNVWFSYNPGFGPTYATADIMSEGGGSSVRNIRSASFQFIPGEGVMGGAYWEPQNQALTGVTIDPTYGTTSIAGLSYIYFTATSPASTWGFQNARAGQDFYVQGGNSNVTLTNNPNLLTCTGQNVNLGNVAGYLHFYVTNSSSYQGYSAVRVTEICNSNSVTNSETVTYSAVPAFSTATRASMMTLTGNVTSFTLGAGTDGQEKTLEFCQNATGGFTVAAPANVHGFMTVGTTASKCSAQHFIYSAGEAAWLADSPGVVNE
jgi:hypothetical protein